MEKAALPTSGGGSAIMELRLRLRDVSGLSECRRLGLRRWHQGPGLPLSWIFVVAAVAEILNGCSRALSYC